MAERPVFEVTTKGNAFVKYHSIQFSWNSRNNGDETISDAFINRARKRFSNEVLDLSSNSKNELSKRISARHLTIQKNDEEEKVIDIFNKSRLEVEEEKEGGRFKVQQNAYEYEGEHWPSWPRSAFYDFLCVQALNQQEDVHEELLEYQLFSDLRSVAGMKNIYHAGSVALFVSLKKRNLLETALTSKQDFLKFSK